jgi:Iron-binding zinc finger CDGSH type
VLLAILLTVLSIDPNERQPLVTVFKDGPYLITGGIGLIGNNIQWAEEVSKEHYMLCRCGASNISLFVIACIE